jgi:fermentation-respiration switch protein FrsA (DUF1100 family)
MQSIKLTSSHYGFSATRIQQLDSSEYTLVTITADDSGSVHGFASEIENCIAQVARACRHSPRADNLLLRVTTFDDQVREVHGFKPLGSCAAAGYTGCLGAAGATALYDAAENAIEATRSYGETLTTHGYDVNAIAFVITDGADNVSRSTAAQLKDQISATIKSESLSGVTSILIGVGVSDPSVSQYLRQLKTEVGFDHYLELGDATEQTLAGLADFVSRSIYATSRALSGGKTSVSLSF